MKGVNKMSAEEFSRIDSDRTRHQSFRVKKRIVMRAVTLRQGPFTQSGKCINSPPGKVVAAEAVNRFKLDSDQYK